MQSQSWGVRVIEIDDEKHTIPLLRCLRKIEALWIEYSGATKRTVDEIASAGEPKKLGRTTFCRILKLLTGSEDRKTVVAVNYHYGRYYLHPMELLTKMVNRELTGEKQKIGRAALDAIECQLKSKYPSCIDADRHIVSHSVAYALNQADLEEPPDGDTCSAG